MRLVTYDSGGGPRAGVLTDSGVVDVSGALGDGGTAETSVGALLRAGRVPEVRPPADAVPIPGGQARLLPPVTDPE